MDAVSKCSKSQVADEDSGWCFKFVQVLHPNSLSPRPTLSLHPMSNEPRFLEESVVVVQEGWVGVG